MRSKFLNILFSLMVVASLTFGTGGFQTLAKAPAPAPQTSSVAAPSAPQPQSAVPNDEIGSNNGMGQMRTTTMAMRTAAALSQQQKKDSVSQKYAGINPATAALSPLGNSSTKAGPLTGTGSTAVMDLPNSAPDYFGLPNWANSPLPVIDPTTGAVSGGMRKFQDTLPGICGVTTANGTGTNGLGQCLPIAVPDTTTFPGSDYYEIALVEYVEQLHRDLPAVTTSATAAPTGGTKLRGYVQITSDTVNGVPLTMANGLTMDIKDANNKQVYGVTKPQYLGPFIVAKGCDLGTPLNGRTCLPTPVRIKFTNYLPTGPAGDLFIPTDTTYMGAGMGPGGSIEAINVTTSGAGYTSVPTVVLSAPPAGGTQAVAVANINNGKLLSITVTDGGAGYMITPTVTINGGGFTTQAIANAVLAGQPGEMYTQNRATLHLHGGNTPWISDGTPHQWTTPRGEITSYSKGASAAYVPDMWFDANGNLINDPVNCPQGSTTCNVTGASNDPGLGSLTFYYTNQESGRLLFYHDHAYGITRLNVYAGEAAGYLIVDPDEEAALLKATVPGTISNASNLADPLNDLAHLVPLVIQDKTFVPQGPTTANPTGLGTQLAATDPTWDAVKYGGLGNLWLPHIWIPNQNPADITGANAFGRWDYGPWFWPPQDPSTFVAGGLPYQCTSAAYTNGPAYPPLMCPGIPTPSGAMEAMMDTPVINGAAYPELTVDPTAYRFQMLMAGNDRAWNLGLYEAEPLTIAVTNGGSGYTSAPTVVLTGGAGGTGVTANAIVSGGQISNINLTNVGSGYTTVPNVTISAPDTGVGIQATATARIDPITGTILAIDLTNRGSGYTTATVTIDPSSGTQATAIASVTPAGVVAGVVITNPGTTPWTTAPAVSFTGGGGTGATAIASINSEVKMVDAVPHSISSTVPLCGVDNPLGGANQVMAILDPTTGNLLTKTGLPANCYPSSWPTDGRDGGVPDPLTAGPPFIQIGSESGLLPHPVVIPSTPVGYEYNRKSITVLNIFNHGLTLGPAERADVIVDFSQYAGKTLILYNDGPAPVPAFDPRNDYYTGDPDQTMEGGAPSTLPGYGPNTRTIMRIKVNATSATPDTFNLSTLTAALPTIYAGVQHPSIVPEPATKPGAPGTYVRIQDTSMLGWYGVPIDSLTLTSAGSGYSAAPNVVISAPSAGGTQATASVTFNGAIVTNPLILLSGGAGYSSAPTVTFTPPICTPNPSPTCMTAAATALFSGGVGSVTVNNGGSSYRTMPLITFTGGGGSGATATASGAVNTITVSNSGNGYTIAPTVTLSAPPVGGTQATATAIISGGRVTGFTITNAGSGYLTNPAVTFNNTGTGGSGASATTRLRVNAITVTAAGSKYTTPPTVNINNSGTGGSGATAAAVLSGSVTSLLLTNSGAGYTSAPTVGFTGGGTPTTPASATANFQPGVITSIALTNPGSGYTSLPTVTIDPPPAGGTQATATAAPQATQLRPKAIQELFTLDYGRMNATLGVEVPFTNFFTQTTIPYGYVDPPTELYKDGDVQVWKITHNGVDTHFIHFHLFDVQVINRVGWDGMIKPPDDNEVGWKDTVRMNPLEDIIVALKPMKQVLPWELPNSVRPLDVTMPIGSSNANNAPGFANIDTGNNPVTVVNDVTNFGWEYVWHCHILAHEEIDMMRATSLAVAPDAPGTVTAVQQGSGNGQSTLISWIDQSINETGFVVQRSTATTGPWLTLTVARAAAGSGTAMSFTDTNVARRTTYYYRVVATNVVGYARAFATPAVGYPTLSADSAPVPAAAPVSILNANAAQPIFADGFETGLNQWSGVIGATEVVTNAVMGPHGGKLGLAAILGGAEAKQSYVYDLMPNGVGVYDAHFAFSPNKASTDGKPVDIFVGLDQNGQPAFGVQFQSSGPSAYQLRGWVMQAGTQAFTSWVAYSVPPAEPEDDIVASTTHQVEVAWQSGASGGMSLYIDNNLVSTLSSDTSAYQLSEVLLGPSLGVTSGASGTMYFDEFTSSRIPGLTYSIFMPILNK